MKIVDLQSTDQSNIAHIKIVCCRHH